ncbi:MAG: hypothetical protein V4438_00615 [Patescibacteria group bacterium]
MRLSPEIIRVGIRDHNRAALAQHLFEIIFLIECNPFAERMAYLLCNQEIGTTPILNKHGHNSAPNCIGTAFYVAGVENHPYHAHHNELDQHWQRRERQPGESDLDAMFRYCFHSNLERNAPGAFIFSCARDSNDYHAGIYLGLVDKQPIAFAQHGHGGKFGVEMVWRNYESPSYHLPRTLREDAKAA